MVRAPGVRSLHELQKYPRTLARIRYVTGVRAYRREEQIEIRAGTARALMLIADDDRRRKRFVSADPLSRADCFLNIIESIELRRRRSLPLSLLSRASATSALDERASWGDILYLRHGNSVRILTPVHKLARVTCLPIGGCGNDAERFIRDSCEIHTRDSFRRDRA